MSSKMEQIIEEIEDYIDGCKPSPISRNKILVNREQLEELLSELRTKTPEEVKRYQKIISNKEAILADAFSPLLWENVDDLFRCHCICDQLRHRTATTLCSRSTRPHRAS